MREAPGFHSIVRRSADWVASEFAMHVCIAVWSQPSIMSNSLTLGLRSAQVLSCQPDAAASGCRNARLLLLVNCQVPIQQSGPSRTTDGVWNGWAGSVDEVQAAQTGLACHRIGVAHNCAMCGYRYFHFSAYPFFTLNKRRLVSGFRSEKRCEECQKSADSKNYRHTTLLSKS